MLTAGVGTPGLASSILAPSSLLSPPLTAPPRPTKVLDELLKLQLPATVCPDLYHLPVLAALDGDADGRFSLADLQARLSAGCL